MKKYVYLYLLICMYSCLLISCNDEVNLSPVEITLQKNKSVNVEDGKLITVTSSSDAYKIFGADYKTVNQIDFSVYNLVYIQGESNYGIDDIKSYLINDSGSYKLSVRISQNLTCVIQKWNISYLIPKRTPIDDSVVIEYLH